MVVPDRMSRNESLREADKIGIVSPASSIIRQAFATVASQSQGHRGGLGRS